MQNLVAAAAQISATVYDPMRVAVNISHVVSAVTTLSAGDLQNLGKSYNVSRFAVAMQGTAATEPADLIFQGMLYFFIPNNTWCDTECEGFEWSLLPSNGTIVDVDVGGGIGYLSPTIAKRYPHLRAVNQDLGSPIEFRKR